MKKHARSNKSESTKPISPLKRAVFYGLLILLPLLLLGAVELTLRIADIGESYPLFVEEGAPAGYLQPNPKIILRYFPDQDAAPKVSPDTVFFKKDKAPGTYRIMIQGGSSAAGFPYGRWGSMQGMLDQRFKRLESAEQIEVVNTAMAAINSYTLLDFVDEIIDHKPDVVLIYAGHNEFLGVMGAGSIYAGKGGRAATLLYLHLKELRIFRLIARSVWAISTASGVEIDDEQADERSLMSRVAKGKEIAFNSQVYQQGLEQFRANMSRILKKYQDAGIPVIIGSLASNEKDQVPFSSIKDIDWDNFDTKSLAHQELERIVGGDQQSFSAADWFKRGLLTLDAEQAINAREAFQKARDYDELRFRAPSEFNAILNALAEKYESVHMAEVERELRADSTGDILGKRHFLEHVHPTPRGYFLLSEAYVNVLSSRAQALGFPLSGPLPSSEAAWNDIPITEVAAFYGDFKIRKLTSDYPFTLKRKPVEPIDTSGIAGKYAALRAAGKDWIPVQEQALNAYLQNKDLSQAAKVAGNLSDALLDNAGVAKFAGDLYREKNDIALAIFYHRRAVTIDNKNPARLLSLAQSYFLANEVGKSLDVLDQVLAIDANNTSAKQYKAKLMALNKDAKR